MGYDEVIERAARAMCSADPEVRMGDAEGVVQQRVNIEWVHYVGAAKAAIAAMGSPVDEIVAWLRTRAAPHTCTAGMAIADQIEAKWGQK